MAPRLWLMKAEPDSRIVKEKDVKFSVDEFEAVKITAWEGVRNHEAKNLMKEMKIGDQVLFYHSNCKTPGIAGFAEVFKEAYPDYTAWDSSHPYYDPKSDQSNPKWFMIDAKFVGRAAHFVPLALLRFIADAKAEEIPDELSYIGKDGVTAIKSMALVNRGRLSVQRVDEPAWTAVTSMAEKGGWKDLDLGKKPKATQVAKRKTAEKDAKGKKREWSRKEESDEEVASEDEENSAVKKRAKVSQDEAKPEGVNHGGARRSVRTRARKNGKK